MMLVWMFTESYFKAYMQKYAKHIYKNMQSIYTKICRQNMSILFKEICINEEIVPKYTYTRIIK